MKWLRTSDPDRLYAAGAPKHCDEDKKMRVFVKRYKVGVSLKSIVFSLSIILGTVLPGWPQAFAQTPDFGPNVYIFDPSMPNATIQSTLTSLANEAQFSTNRYAVLFMPGTYSVQSEVGYYESVAGLGQSPQAVTINGYLTSNQTDSNGNLTDNFWRSLENVAINAPTTLQWGVSQGADFRRMYVNGPLQLTNTNCGEASGGFIADSVVTGNVNPCSQQQWYTRNSTLGSWSGGVWNMVFSGVQGAPTPNYPTKSYTVLPTTPVSREKAYLYVDSSSNYNVFVPTAQVNSSGTTWANGTAPGYSLPISTFFIAQPTTALADINLALAYGQNLILTPGVYQYSGSINITNPNTIVLGMGFATLVPQTGTAAITVADVDGVQLSGLIIDAGPINSPVLLQIGVPGGTGVSHQSNPTSLNDVFFRIGGATTGLASTSLEVDSDSVILDNIWAWRADHGLTPVGWTVNVANNGVVVNGDNVTALGLAVEHYEQNQVVWNGNGGETIFYQSELPYDVPSQSAWMNGSANGYSSYSVSSSVTTHTAYGLGVYSFFNQGVNIVEDSAITVPNAAGVTVTDAVSVFLSGSGSITHTVDNAGTVAQSGSITSYLPFYQGVACTVTCPTTPANLQAITISPTQINLTWTPSSPPGVVYSIFRSTNSSVTPSPANQLSSGVTGTSYADTTAAPSTTYYYLVQASNNAGVSPTSNLASAITPANGGVITTDVLKIDSGYAGTAPPTGWLADKDFTGGATGSVTHAITIPSSVVNPAPAAVYQTYRKTSGTCTVNGLTYQICYAAPNLTPGAAYIVDLHFAEDFYNAAASRQFDVAINGTQVLTNFDIWAVAGGEYTATVQSFYAVADATGTITITLSTGAHNSPQINGVEIGFGNIPVPVAPAGLGASAISDSQINLNWTASTTSNVEYEVFRSTTPGFAPSPNNLITTTATTTYSDTGLASATTYYYIVEANNSYLTSLPSNQASDTTQSTPIPPPAAPAAPTALVAIDASSTQISLLWTGSSTHSVQYEVFRGTISGFTPSSGNLVAIISATGYSDTGLNGGTTYYYLVEALNNAGSSPASNLASAATPQVPATVTLSNLSQTYTGSALSATATTNPTGLAVSLTYNGSPTTPTTAGTYAVVATITDPSYSGAANGTLVIAQASATVTLTNLSQTYTGSPLPAGATTTPTGLAVSLTSNGSPTPPTAAGSYTVVATITDPNHAGTATGTLLIAQAASAISFFANPTGPSLGQPDTLTALVTGVGQPGGMVVFSSGATTLCIATLNASGSGSCPFVPTTDGNLTVTARYQGDTNHLASSVSMTLFVYDAAVKLQVANTQLVYPGATNITACVSPATSATATGAVQIYDGATLLTTQNVQGGGCVYWYISPGLSAGTHTLTAIYSGDRNNPAGSSTPVTVTVNPVPVNLSASCWNASFAYGGNYQCTVNLSSNAGAAQGSITYTYDGGPAVGVPISNGNAQFTLTKPNAGAHTIVIAYTQQTNYGAAAPQTEAFTVADAPVNVALTPSTWYTKASTSITFQTTVTSWSAGSPNTTGAVSFYDGGSLLSTVPVNGSGQASYTTTGLSAGTHTVTATYAGGTNYASGSSSVTITLTP